MHETTVRGLAGAGLACLGAAGGRRPSLNAVAYSSRARRRAFERETDRLEAVLVAKVGPITGWPADGEELAKAMTDPDFAEFWRGMQALERKFG